MNFVQIGGWVRFSLFTAVTDMYTLCDMIYLITAIYVYFVQAFTGNKSKGTSVFAEYNISISVQEGSGKTLSLRHSAQTPLGCGRQRILIYIKYIG